ncbi:MAG: hypothetical protein LBF92_06450 [Synergistaceae bacterium]|jgi:hypothetical protein|nr:hypothetical protein [Synergistaceae bacterium]
MAVYDLRGNGKSWLDYAGPIVMKLISDGMDRTQQAKAYELAKRTEEEAMARRQQERDQNAEKIRAIWGQASQPQPLSGPEQAMNIAGYTPGAAMPEMERTPTFRNSPEAYALAFNQMSPYLPEEQIKANPLLMNNLNPNMTFQAIDQGDRATAGAFDPATGGFAGQEYMYGTNPTKQYEADAKLRGDQLAADAEIRAARINASRPYAPKAEPKPAKLVPIPTDKGIVLLNPETGDMMPTPYKPPAKGGNDQDAIAEILNSANLDDSSGGGFLSGIHKFFGGGEAQAAPQITPQGIVSGLPSLTSNFAQGAGLGLWPGDPLLSYDPRKIEAARAAGWSDEEIRRWILENGPEGAR